DAVAVSCDGLQRYLDRYRKEWAVAGESSADSLRFRAVLASAGALELIDAEGAAIAACDNLVARIRSRAARRVQGPAAFDDLVRDVESFRAALRELLRTNIEYVGVMERSVRSHVDSARVKLVWAGAAGTLLAITLGVHIQRGIGPRIRRLVRHVEAFKDRGDRGPIADPGRDEITVLANALDAGFEAIARADGERERFLAVAAHELKTPITSLVGFAEAALARPDREDLRTQALQVVRKSSARLNRIVGELLLAARSRSGDLPFHPAPVELGALVRRVASDVATEIPERPINIIAPPRVNVLADEELVTLAVRNILTYALTTTDLGVATAVRLESAPARIWLRVGLSRGVDAADAERALAPFGEVQFEGAPARTAVGLFAAREIARLHQGRIRIRDSTDSGPWIELELPA
ncbi:MAG: sensor histidine kinase, partial [Planctomycetota bacterium]